MELLPEFMQDYILLSIMAVLGAVIGVMTAKDSNATVMRGLWGLAGGAAVGVVILLSK